MRRTRQRAARIGRRPRRTVDGTVNQRLAPGLLALAFFFIISATYINSARAEQAHDPNVAQGLQRNPFDMPVLAAVQAADARQPVPKAAPWQPELRATLVGGAHPSVNVNGRIMTIGDDMAGFRLVAVFERRAEFEKDGVRRTLTMDSE